MPVLPPTSSIVLTVTAMEVVILILTILCRQELFKMSVDFILGYQSIQSSTFVIGLYNLMSVLCSIFVTGFLAFLHFFLKRKLVTLILIYYLLINAYIMAVQKQIYQDTRPWLFNPNVRLDDWTCQPSYGFPSGHSWVCVFIYQIVVSDLVGTKGWKKMFLLFVALIGVLNPLSRMYLGSHSGDQILYGLFNSVAVMVLYRYVLQRKVYKLMKNALQGRHFRLILIFNTIVYLAALAVAIIFYEINTASRPYQKLYIQRFMNKCGVTTNNKQIEAAHGVTINIVGVPFGIIYGFLISSRRQELFEVTANGITRNELYSFLVGNWNYGSAVKIFKYLIINVCFIIVLLLGFTTLIPMTTDNFYGQFVLNLFGFLVMGISMSSFIPLLLIKWHAIEFVHPKPVVVESQTRLNRPAQM